MSNAKYDRPVMSERKVNQVGLRPEPNPPPADIDT